MKPRTKWIVAIALLMTAAGSGTFAFGAGPPVSYTLTDLYRMALDRAETIGIAEADVAIAEATREMALSVLFPSLSAVGNYRAYSDEISKGGSVVQPEWTGSHGITAGQRVTVNGRELTALRIAEQDIEKSRHDLDSVKEAYLFNVSSVFYDVAKARKSVDIAEANVRRLKVHRQAVSLKLKLSEVPKTELFRTEAELAKAEADRIQAENTRQLARTALSRLAGLTGSFDIVENGESVPLLPETEIEPLKELAMNQRAELKSLKLQQEIAEKQIRYNQGAFWPTLGWEGGWMRHEQEPDPANDESLYVGVNVSYEFFDGGLRKARVREARSQKRQVELTRQDTARQIAVEVEQAWLELNTQQSVIQSLESQLRYATENYGAVARLFEHGMANSVDVMDANTLLVTAERQLSEARYNLHLAVLRLDRSTGTFLRNIREEQR